MRAQSSMKLLFLAAVCLAAVIAQSPDDRVEVRWGIADTAATVGRLFRMHVPGDAFSGPVKSYTIKTVDGVDLPSWLQFDPSNNILEGIPMPKDVGQTYLELTAHGPSEKQQMSVTFTLVVRDVASHTQGAPLRFRPSSSSAGPEFVRCRQSEPETVATLVLDVDLEVLPIGERVTLLRRFLQHMGLHEDMVRLVPVGGRPLQDGSALVSGVGDTPHAAPQTSGTFVSWPVGCGQVKEGHFPALQRLDDDSGSGRMKRSLRFPVIGWHVTNSRLQAPKRKRRAAGYKTATPVATPVLPTTATSAATEEETTERMTHTVVERVSPTFIQPTATRPPMEKTEEPAMSEKVEPTTVMPEKSVVTEATPPLPPVVKTEDAIEPTKTMTSEPTDTVVPPVVDDSCVKGQAPKRKNDIQKMTYNVGDVIDFVIPEDIFEDCEVGGTRGLSLNLFKDKTTSIPNNSFFKFDKTKQRLFGLPRSEDVGRVKLNLVATKDSQVDNAEFVLVIKPLKTKDEKKINHELAAAVDYDYDAFMGDVETRMQLSNNIASLFGDPDATNLMVTRIDRGSVIYQWTNKSLNSGGCPTGDLSKTVGKMVDKNGDLTPEAIEKLKPFTLLSMASEPAGACEGNKAFPAVKSNPRTDLPMTDGSTTQPDGSSTGDGDKTTTPTGGKGEDGDVAKGSTGDDGGDDNKLLTTVVPAVVIVVVLLVALLVACLLYRRKRKGKMNVEEKNTFINKHPPVIFPDELDDKPSGEANKPLLLDNGGERGNTSAAAGPPPEYHSSTRESPDRPNNGSSPAINGHHDDDITEMPERPYEPPPPVTSTGGSGKTPRPAQQPFSQPPQILP